MRRRGCGLRAERGQALVEFSFAAVIFFIFVFVLIDGSRAVWQYNTLASAAREGTRYAIVHGSSSSDPSGPGDTSDVEQAVEDAAPNLPSDDLTVDVDYPDGNDAGNQVEVEARYQFRPMILTALPGVTMKSKSKMTIEH